MLQQGKVGAWMSHKSTYPVGYFIPGPTLMYGLGLGLGLGGHLRVAVLRVRVGGGIGYLRTENTQVIPPPANLLY